MIEPEEIDTFAQQMGVHQANVERDYVFGWLLKAFFENEYLASRLVFKGGNCMRKVFYPETRFSGDLDFSTQSSIDAERFQSEINRACEDAEAQCGVVFDTGRNNFRADQMLDKERQSFKGRIYFEDFYGEESEILISVRLDVTEFDRIYLPLVTRQLIHPYSDKAVCVAQIRCMALEELIANKLKCLIQRRHSFDLYDLVYATFFNCSIEINRRDVLSTFLRKTIFERSPGAAKGILLGLPMAFFQAAWDKYVAPLTSRLEFESAAEGFKRSIEEIFQDIDSDLWGHQPFYPAQYRNLILEAGTKRRVMTITYGGQKRDIEPYALSYKRPQNKPGSEYFYAWDLTGGRSSGPGIKTFLHDKIEDLGVLERAFEPRYPIELAKAGEAAHKDYFGQPFSTKRARTGGRSRRAPRGWGFGESLPYTVECPYCQKRFKRKRPDTKLNPHKDDSGYACRARLGHLV